MRKKYMCPYKHIFPERPQWAAIFDDPPAHRQIYNWQKQTTWNHSKAAKTGPAVH